jgi:hypothetical protein
MSIGDDADLFASGSAPSQPSGLDGFGDFGAYLSHMRIFPAGLLVQSWEERYRGGYS